MLLHQMQPTQMFHNVTQSSNQTKLISCEQIQQITNSDVWSTN